MFRREVEAASHNPATNRLYVGGLAPVLVRLRCPSIPIILLSIPLDGTSVLVPDVTVNHCPAAHIDALWKGFDDNDGDASFSNRVNARQCGQVLKMANEISKYFGGSNPQIPYVRVATWNDYEEGRSRRRNRQLLHRALLDHSSLLT